MTESGWRWELLRFGSKLKATDAALDAGGVHSQEVMSRSGDRTSTFDPTHSDTLLHGLNLLWRKQLFCDVTLTAQGQQFHCHKAVLASCSQYFRSLFSSHNVINNEGSKGDQGSSGTPSSSPDDKLVTPSARPINNLHCRQTMASRIRSNKRMLLLVGGLPPGPDRLPSNLVQYYDDEKKTWKILTIMPYNSAHHCVVEVENFLLLLGGEDQWNPNGKHSTNFVSRYDPRFNSWIQLPPMQERRASFFACRLDKHLYVIGGRNETGYLSSVESYNLETNEWNYVSSLPQPLAAHAGAVHNGKIYISGGVHNGEYVSWLYCYDPVMDVWARKQDMNTKRAIHVLAGMNDRLYAIGGNHLKGFSHLDVMLVECYDPKADQWNILQTPILEGRSGPGCAVLDDSIFLVGGYSWSMGAYKSSTICYSPEKGTWTELEGEVAEPLAGPACSTVILPACLPFNK
ncbi:hypothetical protein Q5P01_022559 [Channa striata]|uniref:BTB domain-containing protein n=1 Tax=Channa striata TaxID=64152 RepID=A0AA88LPS9_CHASR|nr:hypothetical protein Q5P01_022559 [Channa striata]